MKHLYIVEHQLLNSLLQVEKEQLYYFTNKKRAYNFFNRIKKTKTCLFKDNINPYASVFSSVQEVMPEGTKDIYGFEMRYKQLTMKLVKAPMNVKDKK